MAQLRHEVSQINSETREGQCAVCGPVRVYEKANGWVCGRLPPRVNKRRGPSKGSGTGAKMKHLLSNIDEQKKTATCVQCGPVRIYKAVGTRARIGQTWTCGRRPAERGVGGPPTEHQLSDINEAAERGVCSICGPTQIVWRDYQKGGGRWGCVVMRSTMGRTAYKWSDDYKRAICPFCNHWHRWDRDQGKACRQKLIERDGDHCAVCKEEFTEKNTPRVDHDHTTGKVRGMLCRNCNVALGLLKDDKQRVRALLVYVEKHDTVE